MGTHEKFMEKLCELLNNGVSDQFHDDLEFPAVAGKLQMHHPPNDLSRCASLVALEHGSLQDAAARVTAVRRAAAAAPR